ESTTNIRVTLFCFSYISQCKGQGVRHLYESRFGILCPELVTRLRLLTTDLLQQRRKLTGELRGLTRNLAGTRLVECLRRNVNGRCRGGAGHVPGFVHGHFVVPARERICHRQFGWKLQVRRSERDR